jgi:hypothetical protein
MFICRREDVISESVKPETRYSLIGMPDVSEPVGTLCEPQYHISAVLDNACSDIEEPESECLEEFFLERAGQGQSFDPVDKQSPAITHEGAVTFFDDNCDSPGSINLFDLLHPRLPGDRDADSLYHVQRLTHG